MITGVDYVVYSDSSFVEVLKSFDESLLQVWKNPIKTDLDQNTLDNKEILYAKDEKMLREHEDIGFTKNDSGESCFLLMAEKLKNIDFEIMVNKQIEPKTGFASPDPYESRLISKSTWMYTLVLPDIISDCLFCNKLYNSLIKALDSVHN